MRGKARIAASAALLLALSACTAGTADAEQPLRGVLTTPTDIDLDWRDTRPGIAGHVLEFATEEAGPYTVLRYLAPQVTSYRHPDLMPHTTFHYRLRSYRGPTVRPVRLDQPDRIRFTWTDHLADEDGFLLELRKKNSDRYDPVAVLAPNTEATEFVPLPGEQHATYRIRAFVLGEQSNVVRLTTGE
ncbi:fibronectin type III domain-containing protein [Streptomyces cyaneus]|uniref:fibronectin type III domain-containing protein n=1 Tax=Streptomyces cyaneus TaxID=1904 RepID=UPI000FF88F07|nr:fibronectin type III domain-containing protein [Streptomyces cyaneus]